MGAPPEGWLDTRPIGRSSSYFSFSNRLCSIVAAFWECQLKIVERNLLILSVMWHKAALFPRSNQMRFLVTSFMVKTGSRMHNIGMKTGNVNLAGQIFNTLQVPSLFAERNLFELAEGKISDLA